MQPEQNNFDPQQQLFKITAEQEAQLGRVEMGPESEAMLQSFGAIAVEGNVALVVTTAEDGTETPSHYVDIGSDLGTRLNPDKSERAKQLPSLEEGHALVNQKAESESEPEQEAASTEQETVAAIEKIIDESDLVEALNSYNRLHDDMEQGAHVERSALTAASEQLEMLLRSLNYANNEGPWAGNNLRNHPQLINQVRQAAEELQQVNRQIQNAGNDTADSREAFTNRFVETAENAQQKLAQIESDDARGIKRSLSDISESLQVQRMRSRNSGDDKNAKLGQLARQIEEMAYDSYMTVDDALHVIRNGQYILESLVTDGHRSRVEQEELQNQIASLARTVRP